jgi:hypothetical protein
VHVDSHVAPDNQACLLKTLVKCCDIGLRIWIVRSGAHQYADAPYTLALLRMSCEWPRNC